MLKFVMVIAATVALTWSAPNPTNIFEIDISPEEAQKYLNSPPFTEPQLSGRTAVLPLVRYDSPNFRSAEAGPTLGHYWKNGHEIENTDDYVEEVYNAAQFHGQDGLGGYKYGYRAPESSKVENRERSGEVTGSYTYKDSNNQDIKVRYWADSEGFHQEDNLPKVVLEPVQEAEDVRQARIAHEKAWQEAAALAAQNPDPQGAYSSKYDEVQPQEYHGAASEQQQQYVPGPQTQQVPSSQYQGVASQNVVGISPAPSAPREGKAYGQSYQNQQYTQQSQQSHYQLSRQPIPQPSYQASAQASVKQYGQQQQNEEPEPTGPPRGFFYSYEYPVSIIAAKNAQGAQGPVNPGQPIDHDTVSINAQAQQG